MNRKPLYIDIDTGDILATGVLSTSTGQLPTEKGQKGETGTIGPKGDTGDRGDSVLGPKGDTGDKGELGQKGDIGIPGDSGAPGMKGSTGDVGPTGPAGEKGAPGFNGIKGDIGSIGPKGDVGPAGSGGAATNLISSMIFAQENITLDIVASSSNDNIWNIQDDILVLSKQQTEHTAEFVITNIFALGLAGKTISIDVISMGKLTNPIYASHCNTDMLNIEIPHKLVELDAKTNAQLGVYRTTYLFTIKPNINNQTWLKISTISTITDDIIVANIQEVLPIINTSTDIDVDEAYHIYPNVFDQPTFKLVGSRQFNNHLVDYPMVCSTFDPVSLQIDNVYQIPQIFDEAGKPFIYTQLCAVSMPYMIVGIYSEDEDTGKISMYVTIIPARRNNKLLPLADWYDTRASLYAGKDIQLIPLRGEGLADLKITTISPKQFIVSGNPNEVKIISFQDPMNIKIRKINFKYDQLSQLTPRIFNMSDLTKIDFNNLQDQIFTAVNTVTKECAISFKLWSSSEYDYRGIYCVKFQLGNNQTGDISIDPSQVYVYALSDSDNAPFIRSSPGILLPFSTKTFIYSIQGSASFDASFDTIRIPDPSTSGGTVIDWNVIGLPGTVPTVSNSQLWLRETQYPYFSSENITLSTLLGQKFFDIGLTTTNSAAASGIGTIIRPFIEDARPWSHLVNQKIDTNVQFFGRQPSNILADGKYPAISPIIQVQTSTVEHIIQRYCLLDNGVDMVNMVVCAFDSHVDFTVDGTLYEEYGIVICCEGTPTTASSRLCLSDYLWDEVSDSATWITTNQQIVGTDVAIIDIGPLYNAIGAFVIRPNQFVVHDLMLVGGYPHTRTVKFVNYTTLTDFKITEVNIDISKLSGNHDAPGTTISSHNNGYPIVFVQTAIPSIAMDHITGEVCIQFIAQVLPSYYSVEVNVRIDPITFTITSSSVIKPTQSVSLKNRTALPMLDTITADAFSYEYHHAQGCMVVPIPHNNIIVNMNQNGGGNTFTSSNNNIYYRTFTTRNIVKCNLTDHPLNQAGTYTVEYTGLSDQILNVTPLIGAKLIELGLTVDNPSSGCPMGNIAPMYY